MTNVRGPRPAVTVERRTDGVAVLRISVPPRNTLSTRTLAQLRSAAEVLTGDPPGAVIVWGGPEVFSSGGDAGEFSHLDADVGARIAEAFHGANNALAAIPHPTIAVINGVASGGGLEVALACDFRVAAEDSLLGQHEILLGLFPGGGGTQRLPRLVGVSRVKDMIFSGELLSAQEAQRIGLVNKVFPPTEVFDTAVRWAATLAKGPADVRGRVKAVIDGGAGQELEAALRLERRKFAELFRAETAQLR